MLMHPLPKHKLTFWELVKSFFSSKPSELTPVVEEGKKLPKDAVNVDRKATTCPGPDNF
jgi:hypothetical protein